VLKRGKTGQKTTDKSIIMGGKNVSLWGGVARLSIRKKRSTQEQNKVTFTKGEKGEPKFLGVTKGTN